MSVETITWIFIIAGAALMLIETIVPEMFIVFIGAAGLVVGLLRLAGLLHPLVHSIVVWIALSLVFVLAFRRMALRLFPSEKRYQLVEDEVDAIGTVVKVLATVDEKSHKGRISYAGTSWQAISNQGTIGKGKKARLVCRENISWVVEPCPEEDED